MNPPRITVYIASRNYGRYLSDAIESVLRQTVDDWELIIVDDSSEDDTSEVMNLYRGHPRISLHRTESIGLTGVCNFALKKARGRYVIRLDGDDVFDENILLVLGNVLDRRPATVLVFPDYYLVDSFGKIFAQERRQRLYAENHLLDMPPNGACTMIRRAMLEEIGGYREDLGAQDGLDLWSKVSSKYKCANVNLPLFYYRRHDTNLTGDSQRIIAARRRIKSDAAREQLSMHRPVIAVIPCRKSFDFIPDLWKQKIGGRSLLDRDIEACLSSAIFDHVIVTSDTDETRQAMEKFADPRLGFVPRDTESTIRTVSIVPTLEKIARLHDPNLDGLTVVRYLQCPFVTVQTIEETVVSLALGHANSATAVEEIESQLFRRARHGLEPINQKGEFRTDFDIVYRDVLSCTATRNRNLPTGSLTGNSIVSVITPSAECFLIDSVQKLKIAQLMAGES